MSASYYLRSHFLIAMPTLMDPNFHHTVALICEHNSDGALGIVVNRPLDMQLGEILDQMELTPKVSGVNSRAIYLGGPIQRERGFVLHQPLGNWEATLKVTDTIGVTSSRDILTAIADGNGPEHSLIALGYAGWGAGQLEREIIENAWLSGPAAASILFSVPDQQRWAAAAASMGVDITRMSGEAGHA